MIIRGNTAQEIQDSIRILIKDGQLVEGDFLPSVRDLAEQLKLNRNTVAAAYKNLVNMGVIISKGRLGSQIKSHQATRLLEGYQPLSQGVIDLAHGNPKRSLLASLEHINLTQFQCAVYGEDIYHSGLLKIADENIFCDISAEFAIEFTHGAVDAIERILSVHLIATDTIAIEQPGFISSICALEQQQYKMQPFTVTSDGFDLNELQHALDMHAQAVIITPRAQNPTGYSLDQHHAEKIKALLSNYPHVLVIIDDHFSLLSQAEYQHVIPESTRHWAVIRSVSKYLAPDFRFAFVSSDQHTASKLHQKLNAGSTWVSHILQEIIYQLLEKEQFDKQLSQTKSYYQEQNQKMVQYLQKLNIPCAQQYDGLNIWLALPHADKISKLLAQHGFLVRSGQDFQVNQNVSGIRISTAEMTEAQMQDLAKQLRQIYQVILHI